MNNGLEIYTLGGLRLLCNGEPIPDLGSRKAEALLVYLACSGRAQAREVLADLLWDERTQSQALGNLRRELSALRQNLGEYLTITRQTVELNQDSRHWLDVREPEETLGIARERAGMRRLDQGLTSLYKGEFLEGFYVYDCQGFDDWSVRERERLHRLVVDGLHDLVAYELENGEFKAGIVHCTRLLELDPLMEAAHRGMMSLLAVSGHREAALAQYGTCRELLAKELGVEPSDETRDTYRLLRSGNRLPGIPHPSMARESGSMRMGECPYRGLAAFREKDEAYFFGREGFTQRLRESVQKQTLVAVIVGSSGAGKSSAVFAGLLPDLRKDGDWLVADFRPGAAPFRAAANALLPLLEPGIKETDRLIQARKLEGALEGDELRLFDVVDQAIERERGEKRLLLVVDQFEELYTLCPDAEMRRRFLDELLGAAGAASQRTGGGFVALLTMRADFMGQALAYRPFADALQEASLLMGPMNREELRAAIEKPAEVQGVSFESGLVERILDDVGEEPGNLPLLEFALTLLWEQGNYGWLTHAAYEGIGQVEGALARYADQVFGGLKEDERARARQVFVQLVRPGEGTEDTRRTATRAELGDGNWTLAQRLADRRLVVTGLDEAGNETVEVVHEALIQKWGHLRGWMEAARAFRSWQERLRASLRQWLDSDRDEGVLLRGAPLAAAEEWLSERGEDLSPAEVEYIQASQALQARRQAEREARRRRTILALAGGLVLALALALVAGLGFWQAQTAKEEALRAERESFARELAAQALNNLEIDPERSILLALQAVEATYAVDGTVLPEAETVLHRAVSASHLLMTITDVEGVGLYDVAYSPDGRRLVTSSSKFAGILLDAGNGQVLHTMSYTLRRPRDNFVRGVAFSPDGINVATAPIVNEIVFTDPDSGLSNKHLCCSVDVPKRISFNADGSLLAAIDIQGFTTVWDVDSGNLLSSVSGKTRNAHDAAFSPDGRYLAMSDEANVWIVDVASGEMSIELSGHAAMIWGIDFSPDGRILATASADGTARIWDVASGQQLLSLTGHKDQVTDVVFSPDGKYVATASADGTAKIWDVASGEEMLTLAGHADTITTLDFSPDGKHLATVSKDGTIKIWSVDIDQELLSFASGAVYGMALSPDGARLATTSARGTATIWDLYSGNDLLTVSDQGYTSPLDLVEFEENIGYQEAKRLALGVAFDPAGTRLVTTGSGRTVEVFDTGAGELLWSLKDYQINSFHAVAFSPDGRFFVAAGEGLRIGIWDAVSGDQLVRFAPGAGIINKTIFSPDSRLLITNNQQGINQQGIVTIWDLAVDPPMIRWVLPDYSTVDIAISPDGAHLATAGVDGVVGVWDTQSGDQLLRLAGHSKTVNSVAYSHDGTRLASGSADGTAKVWEATTGEWLLTISIHPVGVGHVFFSLDDKRLITSNWDNTVRIHTLDLKELIELAHERLTRGLSEEECSQFLHVETCPESALLQK